MTLQPATMPPEIGRRHDDADVALGADVAERAVKFLPVLSTPEVRGVPALRLASSSVPIRSASAIEVRCR
jgi:hypothetical protein